MRVAIAVVAALIIVAAVVFSKRKPIAMGDDAVRQRQRRYGAAGAGAGQRALSKRRSNVKGPRRWRGPLRAIGEGHGE